MIRRFLTIAGCLFLLVPSWGAGWVTMFDGKSLDGWKASELPEQWTVENGEIVGRGKRSHLFWMKEECVDCEFKAKVLINKGGNSGMFFRTEWSTPGFPKGYEAQVNRSHRDPVKTGSLYNLVKVYQQLTPEETWFEQHIIVKGNHIVIKVNGKTVVDFIDDKNTYSKGYLALQQHDPTGVVRYKDLMYRKL